MNEIFEAISSVNNFYALGAIIAIAFFFLLYTVIKNNAGKSQITLNRNSKL